MQPKPNTEHSKTDDKTPTPTEVADSSQGSEKPEKDQTLSPTELVHSPDMDYYFEQNAAYENDGSDDDDAVATDEAAAMAELVQEASAANMTLQVLLAVKRPREEPEHTEPAESEAELVKKHIGGKEGLRQFWPILSQMSHFVPNVPFCPVSRAPGGQNPEKCYGHYGRPLVW